MTRLLAVVALVLPGCANDNPMHFSMPELRSPGLNVNAIWPEPPAEARYVYVGDLTGESNFESELARKRGGLTRLTRFITGVDSSRKTVTLQRPQGGTIDERGRILVADVSRGAVFVFDPIGHQLQLWTAEDSKSGMKSPIDIEVHRDRAYVADSALGRILVFDIDGTYLGDIGGDELERPTGIAMDKTRDRIYVADTAAHDIKQFDLSGRLINTIGKRGSKNGQFNGPTFIDFSKDRLYVSDTLNARVQVLSADGKFIESFGRRGLYVGNFTRPKGLTVDEDGNIYVVESYYDHLLIFDRAGNFLMPIGGSGRGAGEFFQPSGIWSDDNNRIYVADMLNGRVAVFQYLDGEGP